jgi:membrane protein
VPDEAPPEEERGEQGTMPQPELDEPRLSDPGLRDLSFRDWRAIFVRAFKEFLDDNGTMLASALAYSTFFAIPSVLLVVVGIFTLLVGPDTISSLMAHFSQVMPGQAASLLGGSLHRLDQNPSTGIAMTIVGFVLALWSTTGAMTTYMTALNLAYDRKDGRSFVHKRFIAVQLVAVIGLAFLLVAVLLIFGPPLERLVASHAGGAGGAVGWIWWVAEWPILLAGLLAAFATLLHRGPDVAHPRWRFITPGSVFAVAVWLLTSGAFAYYTSRFGSYNKTWGSLAAVIIMLTWLWLAAIALLLGAEINAEAERSRELREGRSAGRRLLAPTRSR